MKQRCQWLDIAEYDGGVMIRGQCEEDAVAISCKPFFGALACKQHKCDCCEVSLDDGLQDNSSNK